MIHLMELPNPDPMEGRPEHGGRDRHVCVGLKSVRPVSAATPTDFIPAVDMQSGQCAGRTAPARLPGAIISCTDDAVQKGQHCTQVRAILGTFQ